MGERSTTAAARRDLLVQVVGFGCLQAWMFVTFFSGLIHFSLRGQITHLNYTYASWCTGVVIISVVGALPWRRIVQALRSGHGGEAPADGGGEPLADDPEVSFAFRRRLMQRVEVVAGVVLAFGTVVLSGSEHGFPGYPWCEVGACFAGMASGALCWSWGTMYVNTMGRYVGARFGAAFAAGALLYLGVLSLPELAGIAVTVALPLVSTVCLRLCSSPRPVMVQRASVPHHSLVAFMRAIAAVGLLGFAESFMRGLFQDPSLIVSDPVYRWMTFWSVIAAAALIAVVARVRPGRDTVGRVNRVLMLVIALLFLLSPAVWGLGMAADVLMATCYALFYLFVWTTLAQVAVAYRLSPRVVFSWGLGAAYGGSLLGTFVGAFVMGAAPMGYRLQIVCALGCACLVLVSFLFVADDRTFVELLNADSDNPAAPSRFQLRCERIAQMYGLTDKETEVMMLVAKGRSVQRIQELLGVSASTVNTHVNHIYRKMDVHGRQEMLDFLERDAV